MSEVTKRFSSARILTVLRELRAMHRQGASPTLHHLVDGFGAEGPAVIILVLALPFLTPVSLGPLTIPASAIIFWLALHIGANNPSVSVPRRFRGVPIPAPVLQATRRLLVRFEAMRRGRRRRSGFVAVPHPVVVGPGRGEQIALAVLLSYGALLLALPIPLLPLSNTLPTLGIIFGAYAYIRRRRHHYVMAVLALILSTIYFGLLAVLGTGAVMSGIQMVLDNLRGGAGTL